jgi:hypothetical protein
MPKIKLDLVSSRDVPCLLEERILDTTALVANERFIRFPIDSPTCLPVELAPVKQELPRFSLFHGNSVTVNGAALLGCEGRHFTADSLVAVDPVACTRYNQHLLDRFGWGDISIAFLLGEDSACESVATDSPTLVLCSDEPDNFGSWIWRFIPKLLLSMQHAKFSSVFAYHQQPWMKDLISLAGYEGELIFHDPARQYKIDNVIIPSAPVPAVLFRREVLDLFDRLHDRQDESCDLGEKLYVSRRGWALRFPRYRALENETGLVVALEELGFVEFRPEEYSIPMQVAIFDRARVIVGPGGSNMCGCIWARHAELIVDIEPCDEWLWGHMNLCSSTPAGWSMLKGRRVRRGDAPHRNYIVDIGAVKRGVRQLIG